MPISKLYKTEAIVIKHSRLGEADRILVLLTPNLGKIRAVARGVSRPKSRLGGHVELLAHSTMMLARGRTLDVVSQSQTLDSFPKLRADLWLTAYALYVAELVERFTVEHSDCYPIYMLLLDTLRRLEGADNAELVLRYFELHLLGYLGYRPELHQCLGCGSLLEPVDNFFSASAGGVLCHQCRATEPVVRPISVNALKVLRLFQGSDYAEASRVRLEPNLAWELEQVMRGYIRYLLEGEVRSAALMDRLRNARG